MVRFVSVLVVAFFSVSVLAETDFASQFEQIRTQVQSSVGEPLPSQNTEENFNERFHRVMQEMNITRDPISVGTELSEAEDRFNNFVSENRANRAKRWSLHYFDTGVRFNEHRVRYLTRTTRGQGINKVDKQESFPSELSDGQTYLGKIEMLPTPTGQGVQHNVIFTPADESIEPVSLPHNKIVEVPELNISFWRFRALDNPYVRVHNYERPWAERFANPEFFDFNPSFRVQALYTPYAQSIPTDVPNSSMEVDEGDERHGEVEFIMNGKYYKLFVYDNEQIRFTDESERVYPGGRYVYPEDGDLAKRIFYLDFNLAHDPPCAYSQAYTCSLPTFEEHIDQSVEAGRIYSAWDAYLSTDE